MRFRASRPARYPSRATIAATVAQALALAAVASGPAQAGLSGIGSATKEVQIIDPNFQMVAYTLTIPADWNFQGTVMTGPGCDVDQSIVAYRVWSDDLRYGVQRMPSVSWYTVQDERTVLGPKCKKMGAIGAEEYARAILPVLRPGATVLAVTTAPQAASMIEGNKQMEVQLAANADRLHLPHPHYSSDAKQLRVEYLMGKEPEEEFLQAMEQISETPQSTIVSRPGQILKTQWMMTHKTEAWIVAERAPKGQLDAATPKLEAIRASLRSNPEWEKKLVAWMQDRTNASIRASWAITNASLKASQQQHDAMMERGRAFNEKMQADGDRRNAQFAAQQDAKTRHTADVVDHLLDQQYYVNPSTGRTSTISTTYSNNWENGGGDRVLTNIQGYDPNGLVQGNWTQLQPIKH